MRDKVYEILSKMPEPHKGRVFPTSSIRAAFETAVEQAKVEDFRFHDLRHSFASQWMMSGGRLESLSKVLGHSTLAMTMRHAHLSPDFLPGGNAEDRQSSDSK
jgi:integrase